MRARHLRQLAQRSVVEFFEDRVPQLAASMSYYSLFALFPLVILIAGVFGLVEGSAAARDQIVQLVVDNVPLSADGEQQLREVLAGVAGSAGLFSAVGIVGLVFSASGVMGAVRNGINTAWDLRDRRPPVQGKLIDVLLILAVGAVVALSFLITVAHRLVPDLGGLGNAFGDAVFQLVPIGLNFAVFAFLYRFVPATPVRLRDVWPGALVAALGYEAAKVGFGFYLDNFAHYSAVYGTLAAVIVFLFFVFLAANIFLLGAEVASEWPRVRAGEHDRAEQEDGEPLGRQVRELLRRLVLGDREED